MLPRGFPRSRHAAMVLVLAFAAGCTTIDDNPPLSSAPNYTPPTLTGALSGDGRVWLRWRPSPARDSTNFYGYRLTAVAGSALVTVDAGRMDTSAWVTGLANGAPYSFTGQSIAIDRSVGPASRPPLIWAAAARYPRLRLYAYGADTTAPTVLMLRGSGAGVATGASRDSGDVLFDSTSASLASPHAVDSTIARGTRFNQLNTAPASGLDDPAQATLRIDTTAYAVDHVAFGTLLPGRGVVIPVRTADGRYARIFAEVDSTGSWVMRDTTAFGGRPFVLLDVSLQTADTLVQSRAHAGTGRPGRP